MKKIIMIGLMGLMTFGLMSTAIAGPKKKPKQKAYKTTWQVVKVAARGFITTQLPEVYVSKTKCLQAAKLKNKSHAKNLDGSQSYPWHCVQVKLAAAVVKPK